MELPNLEGQPGWVIVLVVGLFVLGALGTAYLKRKLGHGDEERPPAIDQRPDTVDPPKDVAPLDLVRESMGMLASQAARSAEDADRAEQRERELMLKLLELEKAQAILQERHEQVVRELELCRRMNMSIPPSPGPRS